MTVNAAVTDTSWSPNYSAGRPAGTPTSITIHHWGVDGQKHQKVVNYLCTPRGDKSTSAHYVASAGRVTQLVHDGDRAWHATKTGNPRSIGIECRPEMSDGDFETVARLIAAIRSEWGPLPLVPHSHWVATSCPGRWLPRLTELSARADQIAGGSPTTNTSEEDDMNTNQDRALARILQIAEGLDVTIHDQKRGPVAQAAATINGRINQARRGDNTPYLIACQGDVDALLAQIAGLRAAIGALATGQGLDGPAITQAITDAVEKSLADLSITLTTKEN